MYVYSLSLIHRGRKFILCFVNKVKTLIMVPDLSELCSLAGEILQPSIKFGCERSEKASLSLLI